MSEPQYLGLVQRLRFYDVVVSIPESAGDFGSLEAMNLVSDVKEKIKANKSPVHYQKDGKDFVFADARQIRLNYEYFNEFKKMSHQYGAISDVVAIRC